MFCYQKNFSNPTLPVDEAQFTALVRAMQWAETIDKFRETGDQALKRKLPAFIFQATFDETVSKKGKTGHWRKQSATRLTGLVVMDVDHVGNEELRMKSEEFASAHETSADTAAAANAQLDSMSPEALYHHIRDEVNRLQLYTDPGFGRQSIIERFHLTKDQASRVFSQGSEHTSISEFINNCRLDHARRLLVSHPEMSISEIATASGFGLPNGVPREATVRKKSKQLIKSCRFKLKILNFGRI